MRPSARMLTILLFTAACAQEPPQSLDQRLEGQDAAGRKEILRLACLNEADWPQKSSIPMNASIKQRAHNGHYIDTRVSDMKGLCREMDALADPAVEEKPDRGVLLSACATLVREKKRDGGEGFSGHAARTRHICEEMLGQKLEIAK